MHGFYEDKTYIIGCYGNPKEERTIQDYYERIGKQNHVPLESRWCHCAVMFYEDGWKVIESQRQSGVAIYNYIDWLIKSDDMVHIEAYEYAIDTKKCKTLIGAKFPARYVIYNMYQAKYPKVKKHNGVYCSELIGLCDGANTSEPALSHPSDFQVECLKQGKDAIVIRHIDEDTALSSSKMKTLSPMFSGG